MIKQGDKVMVTRGPMKGQIGVCAGHPEKWVAPRYVQTGRGLKEIRSIKAGGPDYSQVHIDFPSGKKGTLPRNQVKKVR